MRESCRALDKVPSFRGARSASPESITTGGSCKARLVTPSLRQMQSCGYGYSDAQLRIIARDYVASRDDTFHPSYGLTR
ncbi:hypothetical protein ABIA40_006462 [Bradyrhizobium sp. USDA 223]